MDHASSGALSSSAGTGSLAVIAIGIGAGGGARLTGVGAMCACRGRLAVQRSVHDLASLQYQRMSAQAWPPSGTIRPVGSAIPHNEHWADGKGRCRSSRCVAIDESPHANWRLIGRPLASRTPRTPRTRASPKLARQMRPYFLPRTPATTTLGTLCTSGTTERGRHAGSPSKLATQARTTQAKPQTSSVLHRKLRLLWANQRELPQA